MRVLGTLVRVASVFPCLQTEAAGDIGHKEVGTLEDLSILAQLDGTVGHEFGKVRGMDLVEHRIEVNAGLDCHAVDDVDEVGKGIRSLDEVALAIVRSDRLCGRRLDDRAGASSANSSATRRARNPRRS